MKIVFMADIAEVGMSGYQRYNTLVRMGYQVVPFDYSKLRNKETVPYRILRRLFWGRVASRFEQRINSAILNIDSDDPDVVWIEWPREIYLETLNVLRLRWPNAIFVCFQDDNPFGSRQEERKLWGRFIKNIPFFDLHFVKRIEDVALFTANGARRVELFMHGVYSPVFYRHDAVDFPSLLYKVSFVGTAMDHRMAFVGGLITKHRIDLAVFGRKWWKTRAYWESRRSFRPPVFGHDYRRVIWGSGICLAFVSSSNRDEYSMRSFEIPGAGGFLLAERTSAHLALYREGVEAEFFSSIGECVEKIRHYLQKPQLRRQIAVAGYEKCQKAGYTLESSMYRAINQCASI